MQHIQKTVKDFKYLYYQRHLIKGFFALPIPVVLAIKSPVGNGYVYLRQRIEALRIRDFDNGFRRSVSTGAPIGVKNVPVRGIPEALSLEAELQGRAGTQTWVYTKGDLPRLINEETFTEFLACIPLTDTDDPIIGSYKLISDYYERFIDIYRMVSGDAAVAHFRTGLSFVPFTGEAIIKVADHVTETFDEIVVNHYPKNFSHNMFQLDVHHTETGRVNAFYDEMERARRIGHHLASGLQVNAFHRRIADLIGVAQQARDQTLLVLTAFPVFEIFYNDYITKVRSIAPNFDAFAKKKEKKAAGNFIPIGTRLKWLPTAITMLGFDASSVSKYYSAIEEANELRKGVVHDGREVDADEAAEFIHKITMCATLCETSFGKAEVYAAPLRRPDGTFAQ